MLHLMVMMMDRLVPKSLKSVAVASLSWLSLCRYVSKRYVSLSAKLALLKLLLLLLVLPLMPLPGQANPVAALSVS